ncbi:Helicase associated domain protein [Algibacter sp. R77976]|uniref:Helicase associated domain protein n=1 Tax=Algibacter sp. R77976 TaxID=3093873 RepID=UPI0037CC20C7
MNSKILVIPQKSTKGMESYEKGNCFERLVRSVLELQKFDIDPNVQFTGLEIDLFARHKYDKKNLYVECKAKEKVKSTEIKNFGFSVFTKKPDQAYFIHTVELDKQASGLKNEEFEKNDLFKNVTFYGPKMVIELLKDSNKIKTIDYSNLGDITQQLLIVSYLGDYLIYIGQGSLAYPTYYYVFDAQLGKSLDDITKLESILAKIPEIQRLELKSIVNQQEKTEYKTSASDDFEIVAEVQSGDDWFDYKPAHFNYFVGRDNLKSELIKFFRRIRTKETNKRAFYLKGNSGWGKSSLINAIKGTCETHYYSKRFHTVAFDCRSAITENFVAKAFQKAIQRTFDSGFIESKTIDFSNIKFTSNFSLIDSEFVKEYLAYLETADKLLIIIFDQFEDVFRKTDIFKYFYKFLSDVSEAQTNILVGFSWKSEFYIQPDIPSYGWFQQAKEQSIEFVVPEFGVSETNGILKQLEKSVIEYSSTPLNSDIRNRLIENSQGFPWLIKKLCIHIFEQIKNGQSIDDLVDDNLNIKSLFESDLSNVIQKEQKALELVANKAASGNLFDENDITEYKLSKEIKSLIDKRLIIRSGFNYNVYWDIFRDYIVSGKVPLIRRGYIFKQGAQPCLNVFLSFKKSRQQSFKTLLGNQDKRMGEGTLGNILIELRNFELVKKVPGNDIFMVPDKLKISESTFKRVIKRKVLEFSTYSKLTELETNNIEISQISDILQEIFKSVSHKEKTWRTYSNYFANWLKFLDIDISSKIIEPQKGKALKNFDKEKETIFLRSNPFTSFDMFTSFVESGLDVGVTDKEFLRDFRILKIIELKKGIFQLTELGNAFKNLKTMEDFYKKLSKLSLELNKVKFVHDVYMLSPCTSSQFIKMYPNFFAESKSIGTRTVYTTKLIAWARFNNWVYSGFPELIEKISDGEKPKRKAKRSPKTKSVLADNGAAARAQNFYKEWLKNYGLLVQYKLIHNTVDVPARTKFEGVALGTWVVRQRAVKDNLSQNQIDKLNEIGFDWNPNETDWKKMYSILKSYYLKNGNSNIPVIFPENSHLGKWCFKQRQNYRNDILKTDKIELLEELEFIWFPQDVNFEDKLKELYDFYLNNGHFKVPSKKIYQSLYNWFNAQKRHFRKGTLIKEKINRFKDIGYNFESSD